MRSVIVCGAFTLLSIYFLSDCKEGTEVRASYLPFMCVLRAKK